MVDFTQALVEALENIPGISFSGIFGVSLIVALLISYAIYLIFSIIVVTLALKFLNVEKFNYSQVIGAILIRDFIFLASILIPFGVGAAIAFVLWIALLKYLLKLDWTKAVLVAVLAELIPFGILIVLFILGIISLLIFL